MITDNKSTHSEARKVIAAVVCCILGAGIVCLVVALRVEVAGLRAEIAEYSRSPSPTHPVLPVAEAKADMGTAQSSLPAPTGSEAPLRECLEHWQRHIEGPLLRAEIAMLAQRSSAAIALVHDTVQESLAADKNEIQIQREATQLEQNKHDLELLGKIHAWEASEKSRKEKEMIEFNTRRQEEMDGTAVKNRQDEREYNERRRRGVPISPGEVRVGDGYVPRPPDGVVENPMMSASLLELRIQLRIPGPLPRSPGFPRLARLAVFVRESTGPEIRDLALAEIREAAIRLSADDESKWREKIHTACDPSIATGAVFREFKLPQEFAALFKDNHGVKTMTPLTTEHNGVTSFELGGLSADFLKGIKVAVDRSGIPEESTRDDGRFWYKNDDENGTMTFFTSKTFVGKMLRLLYDSDDSAKGPEIMIGNINERVTDHYSKGALLAAANDSGRLGMVIPLLNPAKKLPEPPPTIPRFYTYEQLSAWIDNLK